MPTLQTTKTAKVKTKSGYDYEYHYVDLADIDKYLTEHNLAYDQELEVVKDNEGKIVGTFVMTQRYKVKEDGSYEEWGKPKRGLPYSPSTNLSIQEVGSYTTYVKRYSACMAFGLATEDDDGKSANDKQKAKTTPAKAKEVPAKTKVVGITEVQIKKIKENEDDPIVKNALAYYKKKTIQELTVREASTIIMRLNEENN